jgi:anti-sigma regulatory factor (Ser/Thr protein kinase)
MKIRRTLRVPASAEGIRLLAEGFDAFAAAARLAPEVVRSVQVALDEVLSNSVHHGYRDRGEGHRIEVRLQIEKGVLAVTIQDDAPPFDPLAAPLPDTTRTLAARPVGGLGILLTRRLMDAVKYERARGRNRLLLRKRTGLPSAPPVRRRARGGARRP